MPLNANEPTNIDPVAIRMRLARNLKLEMIYHGHTIRGLAKQTGVSVSAIVSYRAGKKDASITRIASLAKGIGVPLERLLVDI